MKTKMGEKILNENSNAMSVLNTEMQDLASQLRKLDPKNPKARADARAIIRVYRANRAKHAELQQEITDLIGLEHWLKTKG